MQGAEGAAYEFGIGGAVPQFQERCFQLHENLSSLFLKGLLEIVNHVLVWHVRAKRDYVGSVGTGNLSKPTAVAAMVISSGTLPAAANTALDFLASRSAAQSNCKAVISNSVQLSRSMRRPFPSDSA